MAVFPSMFPKQAANNNPDTVLLYKTPVDGCHCDQLPDTALCLHPPKSARWELIT